MTIVAREKPDEDSGGDLTRIDIEILVDSVVAGRMTCYFIPNYACSFENFDAISSGMYFIYEAVREACPKLFRWFSAVTVIDDCFVEKAYRGQDLVLKAMKSYFNSIGTEASLLLILPCPGEEIEKDREAGIKRLSSYYGRAGFRPLPGDTAVMAYDLESEQFVRIKKTAAKGTFPLKKPKDWG